MRRPSFIVGIGGSAGALGAYQALLDALPFDTDMAFVIVSHLFPAAHSELARLLAGHTTMPVLVASRAMPIWANHVYVGPPNADLRVKRYGFEVVSPRTRSNTQVDVFLRSLAEEMGERAIGVVLSGYDGDGTAGCAHIKASGGTTFAQDLSAVVGGMPLSAQAAGCIDFVLPPDRIAEALARLAKGTVKGRHRSR